MTTSVAVTGMAWATSLGCGIEDVWSRLLKRESGVSIGQPLPMVRNARRSVLKDVEADPSERLRQVGFRVVRQAISDAQLGNDVAGASLVLGTGFGSLIDNREHQIGTWVDDVAAKFTKFERVIALSTACCSGADSIALGFELIREEHADLCVCGGVDVLTIEKLRAHSALTTMSPTTLRAFDRRHDGTLLGEGAACVVLERYSRARARGIKPLAILKGIGLANDAVGLTSPNLTGTGVQNAIEQSMADAQIAAGDIGVLNAHGSGTPVSDNAEQKAIATVFQHNPKLLIFATKAALGHTLGATGAIEAILTVLALRDQLVPPILDLELPDETFPCRFAIGESQGHTSQFGISVSMGFGGFNTSLVFERW